MNDNDKENEATTGKCAECRGETPARDTHQCAACHVTLCESCVETCHDCGVGLCHGCCEECQCAETLCHDCALPCSACGRMLLCSDCAVRCDVCDCALCYECEYRCEDCDCALCYECVYDFADDYAYCSDCWNSRRQEPYYADSPCWLKMQEHKHMLTIGLESEISTPYRRNGKTRANHGRRATGSPAPPRPPRPEPGRTPPPQAGTEDGEGRNVRRSPACNRRRDTARRTFRPSPSGEQAND